MQVQPSFSPKQCLIDTSLRQNGLLTSRQLEQCGCTRAMVTTLIENGELIRIRRGVYRSAYVPVSREQRLHAACLGRAGTYASHRSAAALHGIRRHSNVTEIITVGDVRPSEGLLVHRSKSVLPCDVTTIANVPCTDVTRTLVDLGDVLAREELEEALDQAVTRRATSMARVEWRLSRMPMTGSKGAAALRSLLNERAATDRCESVLEAKILSLLRRAHLPLPISQYAIELPNGKRFRADFAYPDLKLIIEAQGYKWHSGRSQWRRDLLRSTEFALLGWLVVYLTWEDVTRRQSATVARLRSALTPQLWDAT